MDDYGDNDVCKATGTHNHHDNNIYNDDDDDDDGNVILALFYPNWNIPVTYCLWPVPFGRQHPQLIYLKY